MHVRQKGVCSEVEADAKIATHAGVSAAHHAVASNVIWKDASENALTLLNQTTAVAFTDLDLTAFTSANAKFAIVRMHMQVDSYVNGYILLQVRKNGTTPTHTPTVYGTQEAESRKWAGDAFIIGLDAGQVIEYQISLGGGTSQADYYIDVLGYIE